MNLAPEAVASRNIADATVDMLVRLGVTYAFGIIGGGIAPFADALEGRINLIHCRHEAGAAFAAAEYSLASGKPAVVFVTTGPGLLNALNGVVAARWEGAHVIVVSSVSSPAVRGRWAFQETTPATVPDGVFSAGACFDYAAIPESSEELATIETRLKNGLERPNGFIANIGLSRAFQQTQTPPRDIRGQVTTAPSRPQLDAISQTLATSRFVIWVGRGARHCARQIQALVARSHAHVMSSPRGKGIFPESDPLYLGVTGLGGDDVASALRTLKPEVLLVLGTRLGEFTSFWDPSLMPSKTLVHVDVDDSVFGAAYPQAVTHGIRSEVGAFLDELLRVWPINAPVVRDIRLATSDTPTTAVDRRVSSTHRVIRAPSQRVRPSVLMQSIQSVIVEQTDALVMTEAGNSFAWGSGSLRFDSPRYRTSTGWGSMGQAAAGVLGAAIGTGRKAVAVLGDGAMLMQSELNTAAQYAIPAVWIVLNDGRYGMIDRGMSIEGLRPRGTTFPQVDFVSFANSVGVASERVTLESELDAVLARAMAHDGPFVVDVVVDPDEPAPIAQRIASLQELGGRT